MGKKIIQGTLEITDGIKLTAASDVTVGGDRFGGEFLYASTGSKILVENGNDNILIAVEDSDLGLHNLAEPQSERDAATKKYVDESQVKVKRFI